MGESSWNEARWLRGRRAVMVMWASMVMAACSSPPAPVYAVADRGADGDGDGAADIDDACPQEAEDGLPPKANDGCPADDPDNDGIARKQDRCPDAKEDGAEPNPADGCPSPDQDADGDGVADAKDACADALEDNIGAKPSDGCPDGDGDGDGIADAADLCPDQAETINGYRDADGCPDVGGDKVSYDKDSQQIYIPESMKIAFESDSFELPASSKSTLDSIAAILKEHPDIERAEIEGHASTKGNARYNVALTERRAISVAKALTERDIDKGRLVVIGYGEYCPAVPTADEVAEPKNRRVELKAVLIKGVWQDVRRGCWRAQTHGLNPTTRKPGVFQTTQPLEGDGGA